MCVEGGMGVNPCLGRFTVSQADLGGVETLASPLKDSIY